MQLTATHLGCTRSGRTIFSHLSFVVMSGSALIITGRNGAGKSTLLSVLSGRLALSHGSLTLTDSQERELSECLHLVGHRDGLKDALTAEENLIFAQNLLGEPTLSPQEALLKVGLRHAADLPVAYLSAGQRRRVALARLLVSHRHFWLLDEPTSALDTSSQEILLSLMRAHITQGGALIIATHQPIDLPNTQHLRIERPQKNTARAQDTASLQKEEVSF